MINSNRIKYLYFNSETRTLAENFLFLSLLQVTGYIFPLLTLPYLAKVIGVDNFGKIAFAGTIMGFFQTLVNYGFNFTATRDIAKSRGDLDKISKIFSSVMWTKGLLMLISFFILLFLIFTFSFFYQMKSLLFFSFCIILGRFIFPEWLFQGIEKMKYITILDVIAKLVFTVAIFFLIKEKSDYIIQPLIVALGFITSGIIAICIIMIKYRIRLFAPSLLSIKITLLEGRDVFINQLFPNLYNSFSVLLLGLWGGNYANGIFDVGSKFIGVSHQLTSVISRTFFPYLSRNIHKHDIYTKLNLFINIGIAIILFVFAPQIINLFFTSDFFEAIKVLRIMSFSVIFLAISNIYGTNYLIIEKHEAILRNLTIMSSIIGFLIAWPLIYYYSFIGAAITITISRGLLGISITYWALKIKRFQCANKIKLASSNINKL